MFSKIARLRVAYLALPLIATVTGTGSSSVRADEPVTQKQDRNRKIEITRSGGVSSRKGPEEWFTGTVRIDPLFNPLEPARTGGAAVTFEPGARTAWHTHPLGQTLIVTSGRGLVQREGGPIEVISPGDVVHIPPGEKHWHGAGPNTAMSHIAIQESLNGSPVEWLEKVTDNQYGAIKQ